MKLRSILVLMTSLLAFNSNAQERGRCEFSVEYVSSKLPSSASAAPETKRISTPGNVQSIFWRSPAAIEKLLLQFVSLEDAFRDRPHTLREAEAKRRMKIGDSRLTQFGLLCTGQTQLGLSLTWNENEPTILFGPGRYIVRIAEVFQSQEAQTERPLPQSFSAVLSLRGANENLAFYPSEPGSIEIGNFDLTGASGRFSFVAEDRNRLQKIRVLGTFIAPCKGDQCPK